MRHVVHWGAPKTLESYYQQVSHSSYIRYQESYVDMCIYYQQLLAYPLPAGQP